MIERTLNSLGLTEYERKAYLFLVRNGTTGAVELSRKTSVPFGRIYDILYQLEAKGFVKVVLTQPKAFSPIQPRAALGSALIKLKEEYEDVEKQGKQDLVKLEKEFKAQQQLKQPSISMVTGFKNIKEVRRRELISARKEINAIISLSTGTAPAIERLAREAQSRGVKRRFIENPINRDEREKLRMKIEGGAEVKLWPYEGFTLSIVDNKDVRIEVEDPKHGRSSVLINNQNLAKCLNEFFEHKWTQSKPINIKLLKGNK